MSLERGMKVLSSRHDRQPALSNRIQRVSGAIVPDCEARAQLQSDRMWSTCGRHFDLRVFRLDRRRRAARDIR
jgi:hypothetical protein